MIPESVLQRLTESAAAGAIKPMMAAQAGEHDTMHAGLRGATKGILADMTGKKFSSVLNQAAKFHNTMNEFAEKKAVMSMAQKGILAAMGLDAAAETYKAGLMSDKGNKLDAAARTGLGAAAGIAGGHFLAKGLASRLGKFAPAAEAIVPILGTSLGAAAGYETSRDAKLKERPHITLYSPLQKHSSWSGYMGTGALIGGITGAIKPPTEGESRFKNAVLGATGGAAIGAGTKFAFGRSKLKPGAK